MNEVTTKIAESDLAEIKMLQGKFQGMILQFGNLGIEKLELDRMVNDFINREKSLKEDWGNLQRLERDLMDRMVKNYGEGNLNVADGTFTTTVPKT